MSSGHGKTLASRTWNKGRNCHEWCGKKKKSAQKKWGTLEVTDRNSCDRVGSNKGPQKKENSSGGGHTSNHGARRGYTGVKKKTEKRKVPLGELGILRTSKTGSEVGPG